MYTVLKGIECVCMEPNQSQIEHHYDDFRLIFSVTLVS